MGRYLRLSRSQLACLDTVQLGLPLVVLVPLCPRTPFHNQPTDASLLFPRCYRFIPWDELLSPSSLPPSLPHSYVSFVEILSTKAVAAFEDAGHSSAHAQRYACFSFFAGLMATWLLGKALEGVASAAQAWRKHKVCVHTR